MKMWNYFDQIYCINLTERKDRYEQSSALFKKYNIPVTYFFATRHPDGGERGCFDSHVSICKDACEKGFRRIIIFEDDILVTSSYSEKEIKYIIRVLKRLPNWDLFFLGSFPDIRHRTYPTKHRNVYHARVFGAHAYAINHHFIKRIADWKWEGKAYDAYTSKNYHYCYLPRLFDQRAVESDIARGINIINHFPFLKKFGLDLNDWYATTVCYSIDTVVIMVLILIISFLLWRRSSKVVSKLTV
jgi:GR25 family glycosyltransferase involved in LPS biosynthesis